jgi:hypothetical protein
MYKTAVISTLIAWFVGLVLDANIDFGNPAGFLQFRILFPILAMGICILRSIHAKNDKGDQQE